jgi:hypothetical protein
MEQMFRTLAQVELMVWHWKNQSQDGLLRHAVDSKQWKFIDVHWPTFSREVRNVQLGLVIVGVNPFAKKCSTWSTWPILLMNYSIPPWLTNKKHFIMLSLIIPSS